ncbi:putative GTP binding protein (Bud4) [Aspergillus puulaauensis]|uniref:Bud site selection protein bud4 n=1 Tax=Aspergillus puulaauensis TaxID=1220207 RepID=A0A7R7XSZ0_9EURO|nr:Bud site selection protein bud4 [Aspergillus puulaauensis]BCS26373.1 Bud site selection protein bud4 [Aspergillus puulaauensis]
MGSNTGQRPLSEVSPMAHRRNSPVWNQSNRSSKSIESSPFESPSTTRRFWQGRDSGSPFQKNSENQAPYDPEFGVSTSKRPSLENLKRASRVKGNSMFRDYNQEYDPASVYVPQRPLAFNRASPQRQSQGITTANTPSPDKAQIVPRPPSPSKDQAPPAKSSLSRASRFGTKDMGFDPENEIWTDIDGSRYTKSVTFDAAPPQVNEYEMTTPDPSSIASDSRDGSYDSEEDEGDISFDRGSIDRDDSFDASLEDLEKTPVVMPEDWRFMSPENANDELVKENNDPFTSEDSQSPEPRSSSRQEGRTRHSRVESLDSNGERRPLPPLPAIQGLSFSPRTPSPDKITAAFERGSGNQRVLPAPPAAATYSESDIYELGRGSMSLEDRLRLMMIQREEREKTAEQRNDESKVNGDKMEDNVADTPKEVESAAAHGNLPAASEGDVFSPPRISRDSILRDMRGGDDYTDDSYENSSQGSASPRDYGNYDPDVPIPSLENDHDNSDEDDDDDDTNSVVIKQEPEDDTDDLYDIPDYYGTIPSKDSSLKDLKGQNGDDESHYSGHSMEDIFSKSNGSHASDSTPVPADRPDEASKQIESTDTREDPQNGEASAPKMAAMLESLRRPVTPDNASEISAPSTPDSVIRHPVDDEVSDLEESADESIPDPIATVKAPGGSLKIRPSLTPADVESMAATRRKVSGQIPPPTQAPDEPEKEEEPESDPVENQEQPEKPSKETPRKPSLMQLDIPFSIQEDESLGFGLDKEFDRVIESQKRGYLMRQNTKVIVASSRPEEEPASASAAEAPTDPRSTRPGGSPQRKASQQTWTTVPWNSGPRRASIRTPSGAIRKKPVGGPVPPLPGQQSNAQEPPTPVEEIEPTLNTAFEDGEERGRLFVKVVGLKYLDMPLPKGERSYFSLTLDNGLHCVTTAWLELGKTAPIGQEFELIVQNDLEFQLTLQMKMDEEKFKAQEATASASPSRQKQSTFGRMFASPRKRKELDMKQQLASQQQQKKHDPNAPVWERLRTLVARDGSFARAYTALSDHEKHAYGRPYTVDVACFNEWAVEEQPSSVKSKKSTASGMSQRRPPYKIGKLELQLLFVPKPKGTTDDDMPKSMNACIREMREAETASTRSWEGFLSQQGGDCPYWRRRFFKLEGPKLTAYHETTRQPRATINLAKAAKLIDDRTTLTQKETTARGGKRRKSAFAEEEEGYMFVEEGFRIRFGNGEVIDFYADSAADKEGWMKILAETVGKGPSGANPAKPWTELVLKRERSRKTSRRETADRFSHLGTAPPPVKKDVNMAPPPTAPAPTTHAAPAPSPRPRHKYTQSQPEVRSPESRRQKARSLIF